MDFRELQKELETLEAEGLRRSCRAIEAVDQGRIFIEGKWRVHLGSNSYLGLNLHPRVKVAAEEATRQYGTGAGSARLIGGTLPPHEALEQELAEFKRAEACLLFSTGYMANLGVITALVGKEDLVVGDRLNHASLVDACRLSRAVFRVYPHGDADRLEEVLRKRRSRYRRALLVTEGLFSMDGDQPPLARIARIAQQYDCWLLLDDAHGTGVFGAEGRGSLEDLNVPPEGILQMGTLSKALGSVGGYLAGPKTVVDLLRNRARSFIYTTALPAACAAAALEALKVLREEPVWRRRLWENIDRWRRELAAIGYEIIPSRGPIVPIRVGSQEETMALAQTLFEAGVYAPGIRPPTVPAGSCRIRTSMTALHGKKELDLGVHLFRAAYEERWTTSKTR